jgi:hypothetical protein
VSYFPSPFLLYFSDRVLCFCLGLASEYDPTMYVSSIAGITAVYYHAQLTC